MSRSENAPLPPWKPSLKHRILGRLPRWIERIELRCHWWWHYDNRPRWWFWEGD